MAQFTKHLIVVAGPTAVGKTEVTVKLAQYLNCPILSTDSRQCYRELGIATAKPTQKEQQLVKHHFVDSHNIEDNLSAADFEDYALETLQNIFQSTAYCLATGGSGLYTKALCEGLDKMPSIPDAVALDLEKRLNESGLDPLLAELEALDPAYFKSIDTSNSRRVIRALQVCIATGRPFSEFRKGSPKIRPFNMIKLALNRDRKELYKRIDLRMDQMIAQGLFKEAEKLYEYRDSGPLQTVGYQEVFDYLEGTTTYEEAVRLLKRNSRRYAKRQFTWFRKDPQYQWFEANDWPGILQFVTSSLGIKNVHHSK